MIYGPKMCYENLEKDFSALESLGERKNTRKTRSFPREKIFLREIAASRKHTCLRRIPRMTSANKDRVDEKMIFQCQQRCFHRVMYFTGFSSWFSSLGTSSRRSWVICIRFRKAAISFARLAFIRKFVGQRDANGVSGNLASVVWFRIYLTL